MSPCPIPATITITPRAPLEVYLFMGNIVYICMQFLFKKRKQKKKQVLFSLSDFKILIDVDFRVCV